MPLALGEPSRLTHLGDVVIIYIVNVGYFYAGQSDTGVSLSDSESDDEYDSTSSREALWLVYKWESLQPLTFYPAAEQPKPRTGLQLWRVDDEADSLRARCGMLRYTSCCPPDGCLLLSRQQAAL